MIFVAGNNGQVALSLAEMAAERNIALQTHGRPDFDLTDEAGMRRTIDACKPTAIVNAAAYTAVDAAENDETTAHAINATGAAALAKIAAEQHIPFIHLSTDYVFDGEKPDPYVEDDATAPTGAYGRTKRAGEQAVIAANPDAIILRTAWVYSPFGKNFLKTMLSLRERESLGVVNDQVGNPTYAIDIATAVLDILAQPAISDAAGIYHLAGTGSASWHSFAETIFKVASAEGAPSPTVKAITTADYPTPAKRPANSRLDCTKLYEKFGISLPDWQTSTVKCVKRLSETDALG